MALIKLRSQCPMLLIAAHFTYGCKISLTQRKPVIMQRRLSMLQLSILTHLEEFSIRYQGRFPILTASQFMLSQGCVREFQMQIDN